MDDRFEDEPKAPGRPSLQSPQARDKYVAMLLERLRELEQKTDPAGGERAAAAKDEHAFEALETAGRLVKAVAGWAIDHQIGLAQRGLQFVPAQPYGVKNHPEYLEKRAAVDRHEHELRGAASRDLALEPVVARRLLCSLLLVNPGAFPRPLRDDMLEALRALDCGEMPPLLRPVSAHRKRGHRALALQLRAIGFVAARVALGMSKIEALEMVAAAYGVTHEAPRMWERRLRKEFGDLEVDRTISFARNYASHIARSPRRGRRFTPAAIAEEKFGDIALRAAGQAYRDSLGE